jgi:hypothetical protein
LITNLSSKRFQRSNKSSPKKLHKLHKLWLQIEQKSFDCKKLPMESPKLQIANFVVFALCTKNRNASKDRFSLKLERDDYWIIRKIRNLTFREHFGCLCRQVSRWNGKRFWEFFRGIARFLRFIFSINFLDFSSSSSKVFPALNHPPKNTSENPQKSLIMLSEKEFQQNATCSTLHVLFCCFFLYQHQQIYLFERVEVSKKCLC